MEGLKRLIAVVAQRLNNGDEIKKELQILFYGGCVKQIFDPYFVYRNKFVKHEIFMFS